MSNRVTDVRISECWAASAAAAATVVVNGAARAAWERVFRSDWCPGSACCLSLRITCDFEEQTLPLCVWIGSGAGDTDAADGSVCSHAAVSTGDRTSPRTTGPGSDPERLVMGHSQLDL